MSNESFKKICDFLNLTEYLEKGYKGQGVKVASTENAVDSHGYKVMRTVKTIAPLCEFYSYADETGISATGDDGTTQNFPKFVDWCIENKIDIVTSSLNWSCDKEIEQEAIRKLYDSGIIYFNTGVDKLTETKKLNNLKKTQYWNDEIITVGGIALNDNSQILWSNFEYGEVIDVVSLAKNVPFEEDDGTWSMWSGLSAATPMIAGMFAVLKSTGFKINSHNAIEEIILDSEKFAYKGINYNVFKMPSLKKIINQMLESESIMNENISEWAKKDVAKMVELGITDGSRPKDNITREEVIVLIARLYELIKN